MLQQYSGDLAGTATFSPDNRWLLVRNYPLHTVAVIAAQDAKRHHEFADHHGVVTDAEFTPDGRFIITVAADSRAYVYDATKPFAQRTVLKGLPMGDIFIAVDALPKNRLVALWSYASIDLFDLERSVRLAKWKTDHEHLFYCVKFTPDGRNLMVARPGDIRLLPLDPLAYAREHVSRQLTPHELQQFDIGTEAERAARITTSRNKWATAREGISIAYAMLGEGDLEGCSKVLTRVATFRRVQRPEYWFVTACAEATAASSPAEQATAIGSLRRAVENGFSQEYRNLTAPRQASRPSRLVKLLQSQKGN